MCERYSSARPDDRRLNNRNVPIRYSTIAAIQEMRWKGSGNIRSNNHTVFYRCSVNHESGVGFIVKNNILTYVK